MFANDIDKLNRLYKKNIISEVNKENDLDVARKNLFKLFNMSAMLHDLIHKDKKTNKFVFEKINEALSSVESIYNQEEYRRFKDEIEKDALCIEEETETDLYKSIYSGGKSLVSRIKKILMNESTESLEELLYQTISILEQKK